MRWLDRLGYHTWRICNYLGLMGIGLLGQFVGALLVLLLLAQTAGLDYWRRVGFVALVGVTIGFVSHFPYWNWFGFSGAYILTTMADILIGWVLAGLVMAKFVK
jgi:hypothetical protein